jgi:hypothetical protein
MLPSRSSLPKPYLPDFANISVGLLLLLQSSVCCGIIKGEKGRIRRKEMVFQSPNCPLHSLRELVSKSTLIFESIGVQPATKLDIAHALEYKGLHGTSYVLITDNIEYGLLEKTDGDQLKLSKLVLDIRSPRGDEKRINALKKAAFTPFMFNKLHTLYGDALPDDAELEKSLKSMGLNPNKISAAVSAYRDTIDFLNEEISGSASESLIKQDIKESTPTETFKSDSLLSSPLKQREEGEVAWKIADNFIQMGYKGQVTRKALQRLVRYLQVNMDDYPPEEKQEEEELTWKITDNSIQVSYIGPVTQRILQRLVRYLQVNMDDYPPEERTSPENGNRMD